ncbi:Spo0E family sporulation regulatory protein-aspartic acid phosphatase [Brevibacillus borstelensis]|uniref:Spo0E family sporulation regulatory protein-aspartic acid phosphatase n=1 Tax=Brevibacillus borstelensis TaxID=45462 RepID=UPI0030C07E9D
MEKYEECITFGKTGHAEDPTNNEVKERVALAICNSYQTIEELRRELARLVQEKGSFTDEVVVELSQRLDGYIYAIQSGRHIQSKINEE